MVIKKGLSYPEAVTGTTDQNFSWFVQKPPYHNPIINT